MLVLSRKIGDKIIIDNNIEIEVVGVKGDQVRLGIKAPKDVPVHREEVHAKITAALALTTPKQI
jgi:carbon storage regulator